MHCDDVDLAEEVRLHGDGSLGTEPDHMSATRLTLEPLRLQDLDGVSLEEIPLGSG